MSTNNITYNLNEIISTKNEFQDILRENGINPGTVFSEYPSQIRSIIGSGGGGGSIDEETLYTYIGSYLSTYNFVDQPSLSYNSYITEAAFNNGTGGFITDIQNSISNGKHILLYNRGEAITPSVLSSCGYITSADVPAIDENLIPKTSNTYTLGDTDHYYDYTYTNRLNFPGTGGWIRTGTNPKVFVSSTAMRPYDSSISLGTSSNKWGATYTSNLYADTIHNFIWTGTSAQYAALADYTTYQIYLIQEA